MAAARRGRLPIALDQGADGAAELARQWVVLLRDRWWEGDTELADQLAARLQTGPTPMLRPLPIDLDQLAGILQGDPMTGGGRVDLRTGEVWPQPVLDDAVELGEEDEDDEDDASQWLTVECEERDPHPHAAHLPDSARGRTRR